MIQIVKSGEPVRIELAVRLDAGPGAVERRRFEFDPLKLEVAADPADNDPDGRFILVRATHRAKAGEVLTLRAGGDNLSGPNVNVIWSNTLEFQVLSPIGQLTASSISLSQV